MRPDRHHLPLRLGILNPGHFHAALPLRCRNPWLAEVVQVHANEGPELDRFLTMVGQFNARVAEPTAWHLEVHRSSEPLAALLAMGGVDVVVIAGRNRGKMAHIRALVEAGIHVLADKPWVVEPDDIRHLEAIATAPAHWADMMTERHEPWAQLFATLARSPTVVGVADPSRGPAISIATVHHLAKQVDGKPLVRPTWYFDVNEQGEGLIDVTTHLIDQVQVIAEYGDMTSAMRLHSAHRWATSLTETDYRTITGSAGFPMGLATAANGVLHLMANGRLDFTCGTLTACVQAEWRLRADDGRGDRHTAHFHGTAADLSLVSSGAGCCLEVQPHGDIATVQTALATVAPNAVVERDGSRLFVCTVHSRGHETHFSSVLTAFLAGLAYPQPAAERATITARYRLLAEALTHARG